MRQTITEPGLLSVVNVDPRRLALVKCTLADGTVSTGTGYLVNSDLLLTAGHVVPQGASTAKLSVRIESDGAWCEALLQAAWRDADLDAMLIRLCNPRFDVDPVDWMEEAVNNDVRWHSCAFPKAGTVKKNGSSSWKTVGLGGTLYAGGGGGQGDKQLDLGVDDPPSQKVDDLSLLQAWAGASGCPVVVNGRLAGIIKQVPPNFGGGRLIGVPTALLFKSPEFRIALESPWLALETLPKTKAWVLVVQSETEDAELGRWVDGSLKGDQKAILQMVDGSFELQSVKVRIADAIVSPARWLSLVRALCLAPIAIFDATDFEPAVMLALGVRAVVRRGVTITSTARKLSAENIAKLPFNMKETKLIHHSGAYKRTDERHPHKAIANAIKMGWSESRSQPRYLDLPAYEGVRCPYPASSQEDIGAVERILMLCPFAESYSENWLFVSNTVVQRYPSRGPMRTLDASSPRLVGQALYESIRWARTCIIDWTDWRPNVFFELGVRLACSDIGPVCLIDADDPAVSGTDPLPQKRQLLEMWRPTSYYVALEDDKPSVDAKKRQALAAAFQTHDAVAANRAAAVPLNVVPHDATYRTCRRTFEWSQEGLTLEPQDLLRRSVVEPYGPDPQIVGKQPILYAADNVDYSLALEVSIRERWIAAWYYMANRYPREQWLDDPALREKVRTLANHVLQFGPGKAEIDPILIKLREALYDVIDEIDGINGEQMVP